MRTLGVLILMVAVLAGGWWIARQPSDEGGAGRGRQGDEQAGPEAGAPQGALLDAPVAAPGAKRTTGTTGDPGAAGASGAVGAVGAVGASGAMGAMGAADAGPGNGGASNGDEGGPGESSPAGTVPFSDRYVGNPGNVSMDDAALFADEGLEGKSSRPGFDWVSFKALTAFEYRLPDPYELRDSEKSLEELLVDWDQIPAEIKALDGKRVEMLGFMSPIEVDNEGVKSFSLLANQLFCCFGIPPRNNEWVMIEMPDGERAEYYPYEPVSVFGTLIVGEEFENGYLTSLFRMTADVVEGGY